jgi:hypothetical protein
MRRLLPKDAPSAIMAALAAMAIAGSAWAIPFALNADPASGGPRTSTYVVPQPQLRARSFGTDPELWQCAIVFDRDWDRRLDDDTPLGAEGRVVAPHSLFFHRTLIQLHGSTEIVRAHALSCSDRWSARMMLEGRDRLRKERAERAADEAAEKSGALRLAALPKLRVETPQER